MWLLNLIIALVAGGIAGYIAGRVIRGEGYGVAGNVLIGLVGSIIGRILFALLGMHWLNNLCLVGPVLVSAVGAVVFIVLIRIFVDSDFARKE